MARGQKSKYIKEMTVRDEALLKQLANTGMCSIEQSKNFWAVNRERLQKLENSLYIKIEKANPVGGSLVEVVRLDDKGKKYCSNKIGIKYFYKSNLNQATHDLKLTEAYYQVFIKYKNFIWKNETEISNTHKKLLIDGKDCVDAVVQCGDETFAIEVIGHKYSQETIDNKIKVGNRVAGRTVLI